MGWGARIIRHHMEWGNSLSLACKGLFCYQRNRSKTFPPSQCQDIFIGSLPPISPLDWKGHTVNILFTTRNFFYLLIFSLSLSKIVPRHVPAGLLNTGNRCFTNEGYILFALSQNLISYYVQYCRIHLTGISRTTNSMLWPLSPYTLFPTMKTSRNAWPVAFLLSCFSWKIFMSNLIFCGRKWFKLL